MGDFLLSWLLVPVLLCVLSLGWGLLVAAVAERMGATRRESFPAALVVPIGFAAVVVLASLLTNWTATTVLAGIAPAGVALVGLVAGRARLSQWRRRSRSGVWGVVAAVMPAASVAAPVVLTGHAGLTGYTKITDLGHQLAFIDYLRTDGRAPIAHTASSFDEVVVKLVGGYPGGTQSVVAAMGDLAHVRITWAYQPVLAFVAAMLGLALYSVLRRAIPSPPWRAVAAGVAAQPTILYAYTLAAGIKELSSAAAIVLVAAVFAERRQIGWSVIVPGAVAIAAAFCIFSVTILPWVGMLFVVFAAFELLDRPRQLVSTALRWAAIWALAGLLTLPSIADGIDLLKASGAAGPVGLGNLAAPVPAWSTVGPWITADHRFPLAQYGRPGLTYFLIGIALALIAVGAVRSVLMRDRGLIALGVAGAVALLYILDKSGDWVQLKAFCITAPIALALAFSGAAGFAERTRLRVPLSVVGIGAATLVGLGVLYGNALQYRHTPIVPYDRISELYRIDHKYAGQGPALAPDFDEFADFILRDARGSGLVDPWHGVMTYNRFARQGLFMSRDTDEYDQSFLQTFRLIIRRRNPLGSRPPSDYQLIGQTTHYEIWRRMGDPRTIAAHFPLAGRPRERTAAFCARVRGAVRGAGDGARVRYAVPPAGVTRVVASPRNLPSTWGFNSQTGEIRAGGPGVLRQPFTLGRTAAYRVWLLGSVGRRVTVSVDGRVVGAPRWQESYGSVFLPLGTTRLGAGPHVVTLDRGAGSFLPSTGNDASGTTTTLGPVVLQPLAGSTTLHTVPGSAALRVCRSDVPMDWLEVIRQRVG